MVPGLGEALCVWGLYAADAAAIATFAARLPVSSRDDRPGGAAVGVRQLAVFLRHPFAPAAVPLGALAFGRSGRQRAPGALGRALAAGIGVGVRASLTRPDAGVAAAAAAVAGALALTVEATVRRGIGGVAPRRRGDGLRGALGLGLLVVAHPWVLADLGVAVGDVPLLGAVFLSRQRLPPGAAGPAVHLGHHHGMDGALLAWTGLALSRQIAAVPPGPLRESLSSTLAGLTVYGLARAGEDVWYEQVVKRGWTTRRLPSLVRSGRPVGPRAWAGLVGISWLVHRGLRWEAASSAAAPAPRFAPTANRRTMPPARPAFG